MMETGKIIELLQAIWARIIDPDLLESYLVGITTRLTNIKSDTAEILLAVQAIDANTAAIETSLNNVITLVTAIEADTTLLVTNSNLIVTELQTANTQLQALAVITTDIQNSILDLIAEVNDFKTSTIAKLNDLVKYEDAPAANGDGGVGILGVRRDVLSSTTSATGDYIHPATDLYGRLHTNTGGVPVLRTEVLANTPGAGTTRTYVGWALPGTLTNAATWKIMRMEEVVATGSLTITWAGGTQTHTNIWDNRAALIYS